MYLLKQQRLYLRMACLNIHSLGLFLVTHASVAILHSSPPLLCSFMLHFCQGVYRYIISCMLEDITIQWLAILSCYLNSPTIQTQYSLSFILLDKMGFHNTLSYDTIHHFHVRIVTTQWFCCSFGILTTKDVSSSKTNIPTSFPFYKYINKDM